MYGFRERALDIFPELKGCFIDSWKSILLAIRDKSAAVVEDFCTTDSGGETDS